MVTLKIKINPMGGFQIKIVGLKKGKIIWEVVLGNNLKKTKHSKIMLCDEEIKGKSKL